jgi:hypothetical protein
MSLAKTPPQSLARSRRTTRSGPMLVASLGVPIAGAVLDSSASLAAAEAAEPVPPRAATTVALAVASAAASPLLGAVVPHLADSDAPSALIGTGAASGVRGLPSSEAEGDGLPTVDALESVALGCGFRNDASSEPTLAGDDEDGGWLIAALTILTERAART